MEKLLEIYASDQRRRDEVVVTKWSLVLDAYHRIRKTILNNHLAMNATNIQLPLLNKKKTHSSSGKSKFMLKKCVYDIVLNSV